MPNFFFRKFFIGDDRRCSDVDSLEDFPQKSKRRASFFGLSSHCDAFKTTSSAAAATTTMATATTLAATTTTLAAAAVR